MSGAGPEANVVPLAAKGMRKGLESGQADGIKAPSGPWLPSQHPRGRLGQGLLKASSALPPWEDKLSCQPSPRAAWHLPVQAGLGLSPTWQRTSQQGLPSQSPAATWVSLLDFSKLREHFPKWGWAACD